MPRIAPTSPTAAARAKFARNRPKIIADFQPAMTRDAYLAFERGLFKTERYRAEG